MGSMPSCIPKLPTTFLFLFCENQIPNIYITVRKSNRYGSPKKKKKKKNLIDMGTDTPYF